MQDRVAHTVTPTEESPSREAAWPDKGILEKTWDFFASVPVATVLIFIIAVASIGGTLIDQEGQYNDWRPPTDFYPFRYGKVLGSILMRTGMTRMYTSWWFMTLLFLLGASLVVCSLERFVPLWRTVHRPNLAPPESFVKRLSNRFEFHTPAGVDPLIPLSRALKARRFLVIHEGNRLYADKGRWGRWGPYITHIGLLLILMGGMARAIPGFYFDQMIWVRDGEVARVPSTDWFVRNEKFTVEYYNDNRPKTYRTEAVVIDGGKDVKRHQISLNQPLWYKWVELYQSSFKQEWGKAKLGLSDRKTDKAFGTFEIDLSQPAPSYTVEDYKIRVKEYYPDFGFDDKGKPTTRSSDAVNPGIALEITPPDGAAFTLWHFILYPDMTMDAKGPVKLKTVETTEISTTGLRVKRDLGIPVIYAGLLVISLGVFATFYLAHRRYWAVAAGNHVWVGSWTNRNKHGLKSEMMSLAAWLDPQTNPDKDPLEDEER